MLFQPFWSWKRKVILSSPVFQVVMQSTFLSLNVEDMSRPMSSTPSRFVPSACEVLQLS